MDDKEGRKKRLSKHTIGIKSIRSSVTSKKSPNVYKSWPKMISQLNERF